MEEKPLQIKKTAGTSPTLAIVIAIIVAFIMVTVTTLNFLHSGAYMTVKQIQIGIKAVNSIDGEDLDINSPINASDIDTYAESISQRLKMIDDNADFGPEAVSNSSLML